MRISDVLTHVMHVPGPGGVGTYRNWIFVEVRTDEGIIGFGEATTEWHEHAVVAQIESAIKPRLLGADPADIEAIWQSCFRGFHWRGGIVHMSAMSAIDQALWDIAGKAAKLPVFKLLGGKCRDKIRCYARDDVPSSSIEDAAALARRDGFDGFKTGCGPLVQPFDEDRQIEVAVAEATRLRAALGADAALMIDCAEMFTPQSAHRLFEALRPLRPFFVEEPTSTLTVEPTLRLKRAFPDIPLAVGERHITRWDCREWFEREAIDFCQVDVCHVGGISEMMKVAHFAEIYGIRLAPHNPYGPVATAAAAQVAAAIQNFAILEHCRIQPQFDAVQKMKLPITAGHIDVTALGERPGLGVDLDLELISASRSHQHLASRIQRRADGSIV